MGRSESSDSCPLPVSARFLSAGENISAVAKQVGEEGTNLWQPCARAHPSRRLRSRRRSRSRCPRRRWHRSHRRSRFRRRRSRSLIPHRTRPRTRTLFRIRPRVRSEELTVSGNLEWNAGVLTSSAAVPPRNDHPPCWKNSYGSSLMVFMMGPQFKLTGPSLRGMSTELRHNMNMASYHRRLYVLTRAIASRHRVERLELS